MTFVEVGKPLLPLAVKSLSLVVPRKQGHECAISTATAKRNDERRSRQNVNYRMYFGTQAARAVIQEGLEI